MAGVSAYCSRIDENIQKLSSAETVNIELYNAKDTLDEKYTENHYCGNDGNIVFTGDGVTNDISEYDVYMASIEDVKENFNEIALVENADLNTDIEPNVVNVEVAQGATFENTENVDVAQGANFENVALGANCKNTDIVYCLASMEDVKNTNMGKVSKDILSSDISAEIKESFDKYNSVTQFEETDSGETGAVTPDTDTYAIYKFEIDKCDVGSENFETGAVTPNILHDDKTGAVSPDTCTIEYDSCIAYDREIGGVTPNILQNTEHDDSITFEREIDFIDTGEVTPHAYAMSNADIDTCTVYEKEIDKFEYGAETPNILFNDMTGTVSPDGYTSYNIKNDICADEYGITDCNMEASGHCFQQSVIAPVLGGLTPRYKDKPPWHKY